MDKYTLNDFHVALKTNSKKLFEFVYKRYFPRITGFINRNNGGAQDAKDVFQEAIMAVIRNLEENKVDGNVLFWSYFSSVCRYIWFNQLKKPESESLNEEEMADSYSLGEEEIEEVEDSFQMGIFQRNFKNLEDTCQKLLKMFFKGTPIKKITLKLGFKSDNYTKKRKHLCKEKLVRSIKEDPEYKIFMKDKKIGSSDAGSQ